jgi:hypothetical protein|uniref:Uncharacterized protein n=1 Tax=Populus trichocarpa x Populus deltoides TaxID=3695 RepID=A9PJJ5_9ROSI|nr:unknown [Populus trichocarpa x Populus deltoides]
MFVVESERSGNNETIQPVSPVLYSYEIQPEVAKFLKSEHYSLSKILALQVKYTCRFSKSVMTISPG